MRFHLAPAADYVGQIAKDLTFTMSNAAPGDAALNVGVWKQLENFVRSLVVPGKRVQIYTGGIFLPSGDEVIRVHTIGDHCVWIPTHFAKCVVVTQPQVKPVSYCWIVPNKPPAASATLNSFRRAIDEAEFRWGFDCKWTDVDATPCFDDDTENTLEAET